MIEVQDSQKQMFLQKFSKSSFKWWREEGYLDSGTYTVMHIESVFDIMEFAIEWAAIHGEIASVTFISQLKKDIEKAIGREIENES